MPHKLIVSKEAHHDTNDITSYIAYELKNSQAAFSFLDDLEASYHRILKNPHLYPFCNDPHLRRQGYHKIPIKNYVVLYRVDDEEKSVYIVRIVYCGSNYAATI